MGIANSLGYATALAAICIAGQAQASEKIDTFSDSEIQTGEQFIAICKSDVVGCINYLDAVIGAAEVMRGYYGKKALFCIPTSTTNASLWTRTKKAFERYPALNNARASEAVIMMLIVEFPCSSKKV